MGVTRRRQLLNATLIWVNKGGDQHIALQALTKALSPQFHIAWAAPGSGMMLKLRDGVLSPQELLEIRQLWPIAFATISSMQPQDWQSIFGIVSSWSSALSRSDGMTEESATAIKETIAVMLTDILTLSAGHQGVALYVQETSEWLNLDLQVEVESDFVKLFGGVRMKPWRNHAEFSEAMAANIQELAVSWHPLGPEAIAQRLGAMGQEAKEVIPRNPNRTWDLCEQLATRVDSPLAWYDSFLPHSLPSVALIPFAHQMAERREAGWETALLSALGNLDVAPALVQHVLQLSDIPAQLLESAFKLVDPDTVEWLCMGGRVHQDILLRLLQHPDDAIASAAAVGDWHYSKGHVREALKALSERAMLRNPDLQSYWFGEIVRSNPNLAHDWLRRMIRKGEALRPLSDDSLSAALNGLDGEGRRCMLQALPPNVASGTAIRHLVGEDTGLYELLLERQELGVYAHLAPLKAPQSASWPAMAQLALAKDYAQDQIASALLGMTWGWTGNASSHWQDWIEQVGWLTDHPDEQIRAIAHQAIQKIIAWREEALANERREAVFGRHT